jgi:hypothetical protein
MAKRKRLNSPLLTWLRTKHDGMLRQMRIEARAQNYDGALRCQARAEAYAWTILHVEAEMRRVHDTLDQIVPPRIVAPRSPRRRQA